MKVEIEGHNTNNTLSFPKLMTNGEDIFLVIDSGKADDRPMHGVKLSTGGGVSSCLQTLVSGRFNDVPSNVTVRLSNGRN